MRFFRALTFAALMGLLSRCNDDRAVTLETALVRTKQREYNLIILTDDLVSFQRDGYHKCQLAFTPPLPDEIAAKINEASQQAKPPIQVWDARISKLNAPQQDAANGLRGAEEVSRKGTP
jgi:hypothetical protein